MNKGERVNIIHYLKKDWEFLTITIITTGLYAIGLMITIELETNKSQQALEMLIITTIYAIIAYKTVFGMELPETKEEKQ